jgi:hypothetical protein
MAGTFWAISAYAGAVRVGNTYYEDIFATSACPSTSFCQAISSSATPSDNFLRLQHFYCKIRTVDASPMLSLALQVWTAPPGTAGATSLRGVPLSFPAPVLAKGVPGENNYSIDSSIFFLAGQSRYLVFAAATQGNGILSMDCAVTGDMVPPAQ